MPQITTKHLIESLEKIHSQAERIEGTFADALSRVHPNNVSSARNLLHYIALRRVELRQIQDELASLGLSSLGRCEAHVLGTLDAVLSILYPLSGMEVPSRSVPPVTMADAARIAERKTDALFGKAMSDRRVRIMVTMPSEASDSYELIKDLLSNGMECMRINCAHDGPSEWHRMINHLHRAEKETSRSCKILMDMGGIKIRTGPVPAGEPVVKWKPKRNRLGEVTRPAKIVLMSDDESLVKPRADAILIFNADWLNGLVIGSKLNFTDARGNKRGLKIVKREGAVIWAFSDKTAYVTRKTQFEIEAGGRKVIAYPGKAFPIRIFPFDSFVVLHQGDRITLTESQTPGPTAKYDVDGKLIGSVSVPCTLPKIFTMVEVGQRILFDDGKIGGVIKGVKEDSIEVEITAARSKGERLREDKGINVPDATFELPALTKKDMEDLKFIVKHADIVGFSFVNRSSSLRELRRYLDSNGGDHIAIMLKIETRSAFERLPELLLTSLEGESVGVMVARGDLAIECGYDRLAEVQEEILWLCEAAHIPVTWATEVLENLAKTGRPSRAEVTDAAMSERAECVMLNKGPHILEAIVFLDNVLQRMQGHQSKKKATLRPLRLALRLSTSVDSPFGLSGQGLFSRNQID